MPQETRLLQGSARSCPNCCKRGLNGVEEWSKNYRDPGIDDQRIILALGGIIGEDFLAAYQAILDIGRGALYLKPEP